MFHLGADAGFEPLKSNYSLVFTRVLFEVLDFARAHGNRPFSLNIGQLFTMFRSLISGIGEHKLFLAMEQITYLIEVVLVG